MKMKFFLTLTMFSLNAHAFQYPYNPLSIKYTDKPGSVLEITEATPIKSQDGLGYCYAFSSTSLLESYRCRELNLDCSDPRESLSSLDVTSYSGGKSRALIEGGNTSTVLKSVLKAGGRVAREECVPFSTLVHSGTGHNLEERGINFLTSIWQEYKGIEGKTQNDCITCLVNDIKSSLINIKTPAEQLTEAFTTATGLENFLFKALLPRECLSEANVAVVPPFVPMNWPDGLSDTTDDMLQAKIETLLSAGTPIEMSLCADNQYTPNCADQQGHSVALFGIKEVCNKNNECRKMVKVRNSYGRGWQDRNNGGWFDLRELVKSSNSYTTFSNISWIEKP